MQVVKSIAEFPDKFLDFTLSGQKATGSLHHEYAAKSSLNKIWTYPLHGIVCIATMATMPLAFTIALVVAVIFTPAALCDCCKNDLKVSQNYGLAAATLIISFFLLLDILVCPLNRAKSTIQVPTNAEDESRVGIAKN